ncbi:MAG: hypothetical protein ACREV1_14720, partial [Gammaproteobacteria bacterium]
FNSAVTTLIKELYEALKEAGASEEKATAAAEALERLRDEDRLRGIEREIADLKSDVRLIKWMLGFNLALTSAVLLKLVLT